MISGVSGFIVGVFTGFYLSSLSGEQISASLRNAVEQQTLLSVPVAAQAVAPLADMLSELGAVETPAPAAEPESKTDTASSSNQPSATVSPPLPVAGAVKPQPADLGREADPELEPLPDSVPDPVPDLEQSWSDYAARATDLAPAGSFPWQQCFQRAAASHDIPEALLLAIASGESGFDPAARSDKDAVGLMQIRWPITSHHLGIYREADLYDPCTNVDAGARYLSELRQGYDNNLHLVVAAYNYGPSRVTAEQVPEGALWYSHYIYQHLQQVLGQATTASSDLLPRPASSGAGRQVLMTFNRAHRARDFVDFLKDQVPGLKLQLQAEAMGQHEVVLLYASDEERLRALQLLDNAGIGFVNSRSKSTYYL
jgi:soluble lytic murein transglycosylase-like protein